METSQIKTLAELPIGTRLLVRSKKDWRCAVVSKIIDETVTILVASPSGYSYRLRRKLQTEIFFDGQFPILENPEQNWRENYANYDVRW